MHTTVFAIVVISQSWLSIPLDIQINCARQFLISSLQSCFATVCGALERHFTPPILNTKPKDMIASWYVDMFHNSCDALLGKSINPFTMMHPTLCLRKMSTYCDKNNQSHVTSSLRSQGSGLSVPPTTNFVY